MIEFVLGMLTAYALISFLHETWWGHQRWLDFIELPYLGIMTIVEIILGIVLFPFVFLWRLFRNVIKPVKSEAIQNLKLWDDSVHVVGPIYFCHDKKAKRIVSKFFFYRTSTGEKVKIRVDKTPEV